MELPQHISKAVTLVSVFLRRLHWFGGEKPITIDLTINMKGGYPFKTHTKLLELSSLSQVVLRLVEFRLK
jgi:hypothetical protein